MSIGPATLCLALTLAFNATAQVQATDKRFLLVLIGPPGSGKTTQAEFLKRRFGIATIAVDDVVRENPSALAKHRSAGIHDGPSQLNPAMDALIAERLARMDLTKGVALDGYPATKDQADHLTSLAKRHALPPPIIIQIDVPDAVVRERLRKRKHADDKPELIDESLKNYHREMDMIRAYYPSANIWTIDGAKSIAEVSSTLESILKDEVPKRKP
jgi:adenylate kinase